LPIAAVIALACAALIAQNLSLRRQLEQAEAARATAAQALADAQRTPPAQNPPSAAREAPLVVSLSLAAGLVRGTSTLPRVAVPAAAATVRLQLQLPAGLTAPSLAAVLRDVDGNTLWTGPASELGQAVTVDIPAAQFTTGDYEVVLRDGGQDRAEYYFSIVR
jgi:hypothetical protein